MQTQKSPIDPHIIISACGCKFHHYQPIPHFKILLDINFHWNRRPLTIWRFCWQPFWNWWPRKNYPECKLHHYQPIPHFKILIDINVHWNRRPLTICDTSKQPSISMFIEIREHWNFADYVGGHFQNGGHSNAIFIITNQFLTSI